MRVDESRLTPPAASTTTTIRKILASTGTVYLHLLLYVYVHHHCPPNLDDTCCCVEGKSSESISFSFRRGFESSMSSVTRLVPRPSLMAAIDDSLISARRSFCSTGRRSLPTSTFEQDVEPTVPFTTFWSATKRAAGC